MHVLFICHGNICRSPMAELMLRAAHPEIEATSAGVSAEEEGNPIDPRAARALRARGIAVTPHTAHRVTAEELTAADLVVCMERYHRDRCLALAPTAKVRLLTDFDPAAAPGSPVPDPWYGGPEGFTATYDQIEAALPGIVAAVGG